MAIDYWKLTKDYAPGDVVQRVLPGQGISPYTGRVLSVMPGIGFVDIQWPWGTERVSPEELLRVDPEFGTILPPSVTFDYHPGLDAKKTAGANRWRTTEVPVGFHKELAKLWHRKANEVQAYNELYHRYASYSDADEAMRDEVEKFYRFADRSMDLLVQQEAAKKTAAYWASKDRNYRATKPEMGCGRPNCPRCGMQMRKTVYKMREGQKNRLFACPGCLYLIKQDNVLGPGGEPVSWGRQLSAMEHPSEDAKKQYLKDHPKADPGKHTVKGEGDGEAKRDDAKKDVQQKGDDAKKDEPEKPKDEPKKDEPKKDEPKKDEKPKAEAKKDTGKRPKAEVVAEISSLAAAKAPRSNEDIDRVNKGVRTLWDLSRKTQTGMEQEKLYKALQKGSEEAKKAGGISSQKGWEAYQKATRAAVRKMVKELGGEDPVQAEKAKAKADMKSMNQSDLKSTVSKAVRKLSPDQRDVVDEIMDSYDPQNLGDFEAALEDEFHHPMDRKKVLNEMTKVWTKRKTASSFDDAALTWLD